MTIRPKSAARTGSRATMFSIPKATTTNDMPLKNCKRDNILPILDGLEFRESRVDDYMDCFNNTSIHLFDKDVI